MFRFYHLQTATKHPPYQNVPNFCQSLHTCRHFRRRCQLGIDRIQRLLHAFVDLLQIDIGRGVGFRVSQYALHVFDAALVLGQRRNREAQYLEVQLPQSQLLAQLFQHTGTIVVRADKAVLRCPVALARIGEDKGFGRGIGALLLP